MNTNQLLSPDFNRWRSEGSSTLLVDLRNVAPSFRTLKGPGFVDLAPSIGSVLGLSLKIPRWLFGLSHPTIRFLLKIGLIPSEPWKQGSRYRAALIDPGTTMRQLFESWASDMPILLKHVDFANYKRVLRACRFDADFMEHPPQVFVALARQAAILGSASRDEMSAFVPLSTRNQAAICDRVRSLLADSEHRVNKTPQGATITTAMMKAAFPLLVSAPGTCFTAEGDEDFEPPSASTMRRIYAMGPLANAAALLGFRYSRDARGSKRCAALVRSIQDFEGALTRINPRACLDDPDAVRLAFEELAWGAASVRFMSARRRYLACCDVLFAIRLLGTYARSSDPEGTLGLVAHVPVRPNDEAALQKRLNAHFKGMIRRLPDSRKLRSDRAADRLFELECAAEFRMEQLLATAKQLRAAAAELGSEKSITRSITTLAIDSVGAALGEEQQAVWRIWKAEALHAKLTDKRNPDGFKSTGAARKSAIGAEPPQVYFQFVRIDRADGSAAPEPWFVSLFRHGALVAPGDLTTAQQRRRQRFMHLWRLPAFSFTPPGLLGFPPSLGGMWRRAALRKMTIVAVEEFEVAMRFAHLGLRCVLESYCRTNEFMQITQWQEDWPKTANGSHADVSFLAIPKQAGNAKPPFERVPFPVDPDTFKDAADLMERIRERCGHTDGNLPLLMAHHNLRWKLPKPDAYVFAYNEHALSGHALRFFLRYLLANLGAFTYHDFRHAVANAALLDGVPESLIKEGLLHKSKRVSRRYWALTVRQKRSDDEALLNHRARKIAKVRDGKSERRQ